MKVFFRNIHLYLSLAAGIVIFGSCLTGTVLVFEKEIDHALHPERYYVKPQGTRLPLSQLKALALKQMPKAKPASIMVYNDAERTVEFGVIVPEKKAKKKRKSNLQNPKKIKKAAVAISKTKSLRTRKGQTWSCFSILIPGRLLGSIAAGNRSCSM